MKAVLSRVAAGSVASVALLAGFASSVASAAPYSTQGPNSPIWSYEKTYKKTSLVNKTRVGVENNTMQKADSGNVKVYNNTTAGNIGSGDAKNSASFAASVTVNNTSSNNAALKAPAGGSGGGTGAASTKGPNSPIKVVDTHVDKTQVYNSTSLHVSNNVYQNADSGDVAAANNTTVGHVSSGDATNTSTSSVSINVSN